jgi:UDP-2,4-diacetamido-2,4,6-trideoxy-beta-L-altropyranose hydrolase
MSKLRIAFRTDASLQIGIGHVMRCLTLADAMRDRGADCIFICRPHSGHLLDLIAQRGHQTLALPDLMKEGRPSCDGTAREDWLGTHWIADAVDTQQVLNHCIGSEPLDWLVVDHYDLERQWEQAVRASTKHIMVIDDLADRLHDCEVLLDQTFGRAADDYRALVPSDCNLLSGSRYALLRPEFSALRPYSLQRRVRPTLRELLITMGGVDKDNATGLVLQALCTCPLPLSCRITVVMGATAPWLDEVRRQAQDMPWPTRVQVGVRDMAQLMADSDLAIGAAGSTSWELCCLGVPNLLVCTAANQRTVIAALTSADATVKLDRAALSQPDGATFRVQFEELIDKLEAYSEAAARVTDGCGVLRVSAYLV